MQSMLHSPTPVVKPVQTAVLPDFVSRRVEQFQARMQTSWGGRHIMRGSTPRSDAVLLQSNDYLDLTRHPGIVEAQCAALRRDGNGMMMSGLFVRADDPLHAIEAEIARHMGYQTSVITQSGYVANTGLVQTLAGERTPVYIDMIAHASLWEGIKSAGAQAVPILHNDTDYLERQILRHGPGVVLVDSVYSTNGSVCPLREYAAVVNETGCVFVVDESHSLGTHGRYGEGLVASLGLSSQVHFVTASLAKAYCARAGLVTCAASFKDYFGGESMPAIFSSTLLPPEVAGIAAAHGVIRHEGWRRERLREVTCQVRAGLEALGYPIGEGTEQIIALEVGVEAMTMRVRDAFEAEGVFGAIFCAPATAKSRSLLRFTLNAGLSDADVEHLLKAAARLRPQLELDSWSGTRRHQRGSRVKAALPMLDAVA